MSILAFVITLLFIFISSTNCANILGIFPAPGYSQFILGEKLMIELAKRDHNVTVISPYMSATNLDNNYKTVLAKGPLLVYKDRDFFESEASPFVTSIRGSQNSGLVITEHILSDPNVQDLIHSDATFDVVIVEQFFCEALMGFAELYKAPLVIFSSIGPSEWTNHLMGHSNLPSYMPLTKFSYTTQMSLLERMKNTAAFIFDAIYKRYIYYPKQDKLLKKYLPISMNLNEVMHNASLMLLNSHYTVTDPFPLVTGIIEIGGYHINPGLLPQNLQTFLDEAKDGAIYFSMGTNLKLSNLKPKILEDIVKVFDKLKQRVLWKTDEAITGLPKNVLVSKWLPQVDILGHRNIKVFVSHGGLLSTLEAVHFGVPMVGIPIFGDQKMNVAKAERYGFALGLPFTQLSEETLHQAIRIVLGDPNYTKHAKLRSKLYHDRPTKAMDLAMYWLEHILEYKTGTHLKFAGSELQWYQLYMLDMFGFACIILCIIIIFLAVIIVSLKKLKEPSAMTKRKLKNS